MASQIDTHKESYEEPEGLDQNEEVNEEYPIDSFMIRTENRTIYDVIRRVDQGQLILDPDFQRDFVWDVTKQSRLIESLLMRIPLPVFYLAENEAGQTIVVDGLQRLTTFKRYLANEFALTGLDSNRKQLLGKKFDKLEPKLRNRIEDTNLTLYLIDAKVPERAKLDIFDRVNSGVPLTRQQMRNSLYQGPATQWLKEQAKQDEWFLKATAKSLDPKRMRDRELINRFCGFYLLEVEKYKGEMDEFLAQTLKYMNKLSGQELMTLGQTFQTSMHNNYLIFEQHAFRKHTSLDQKRSVVNAALFDVFSVLMTRYDAAFIRPRIGLIQAKFFALMKDETFWQAITSGTNGISRVKARFAIAEQAFQEI